MMGVSLADARAADYWEYSAMLTVWNERHADPDAVEPPDEDTFALSMAMIASNPAMVN